MEREFILLCEKHGIEYTKPEQEKDNPSNLDFYLPEYDVSVEVKQFPTERIHDQMIKSGQKDIIVLVGKGSIKALHYMISGLKP
ncbi:hypothetical protein HJG45_08920 [Roseicella sp. DB1501]|nr:hypothetical protein [Roseicella sp. DB1501]